MTARQGTASTEEKATLEALRARADKTGEEAAQTLAELAGRLADAGNPRNLASRLAADARRNAARAVRDVPRKLAGQRGATRAVLAAVLALAAGAAIVAVRRRQLSED